MSSAGVLHHLADHGIEVKCGVHAQDGRAVVKHPSVRYREELIEAENLAKRYRRGVWGNEFDPRDPIDR